MTHISVFGLKFSLVLTSFALVTTSAMATSVVGPADQPYSSLGSGLDGFQPLANLCVTGDATSNPTPSDVHYVVHTKRAQGLGPSEVFIGVRIINMKSALQASTLATNFQDDFGKSPEKFRKNCGTQYLQEIHYGALMGVTYYVALAADETYEASFGTAPQDTQNFREEVLALNMKFKDRVVGTSFKITPDVQNQYWSQYMTGQVKDLVGFFRTYANWFIKSATAGIPQLLVWGDYHDLPPPVVDPAAHPDNPNDIHFPFFP